MSKEKQDYWITVEMGGSSRRDMPISKFPKAQEASKSLIETAVKSGMPRAKAEELYSVKIVKEYK